MKRPIAPILVLALLAGCATAARFEAEDDADHLTFLGAPGPSADSLARARAASGASSPGFTPEQMELLAEAVRRANRVTSDSLFLAIARELEAAKEIKWNWGRARLFPQEGKAAPTQWLLGRFAAEGNYRVTDIGAGSFSYPPTTAMTTSCVPFYEGCRLETDLAPGYVKVDREQTVNALANTLVHERVHSFGQVHMWLSQKRSRNICDAAYVLGDLAETLLRYYDENAPVEPRQVLCGKLYRRLAARGIVD